MSNYETYLLHIIWVISYSHVLYWIFDSAFVRNLLHLRSSILPCRDLRSALATPRICTYFLQTKTKMSTKSFFSSTVLPALIFRETFDSIFTGIPNIVFKITRGKCFPSTSSSLALENSQLCVDTVRDSMMSITHQVRFESLAISFLYGRLSTVETYGIHHGEVFMSTSLVKIADFYMFQDSMHNSHVITLHIRWKRKDLQHAWFSWDYFDQILNIHSSYVFNGRW